MQNLKPKKILIAGGGVGGLSAALNVKAKIPDAEVTIIEQHLFGGKAAQIEQQGFKFDPGPSIIIMTEIYEELFKLHNRNIHNYIDFKKLEHSFKVYFNGKEYLIPADRENFLKFIEKNFPDDLQSIKKILELCDNTEHKLHNGIYKEPILNLIQFLKPQYLTFGLKKAIRTPFKKFVDQNIKSPMLKALFYGFPTYSGQSYHSISPSSLYIPYYIFTKGIYYPMGGIAQIPNALIKLCKELKINLVNAQVTKITKKDNKITSVTTTQNNQEQTFKCDYLVSNIDKLIFGSKFLNRDISKYKPSYSYYTLHLGINKKLQNVQLHNQFIPTNFDEAYKQIFDNKKMPEKPLIYLNVPSAIDPSIAPPNNESLFFVVSTPAIEPTIDWEHYKQTAIDFILNNVKQYGIDIKKKEIITSRIQTPLYFEEQHNNYKGSLYGADEKFNFLHMFPDKNTDTQYKNLFYCGGSVQPGAGLPMVMLSGKFAADLVYKTL